MQQYPKREMDELISSVRAWRSDAANESMCRPLVAAHAIGAATGVDWNKWLNLIDAICSGVAPEAENFAIYDALRTLGWEMTEGPVRRGGIGYV